MIKRLIYQQIIKHLDSREIIVITGARQVGKTTLLKMLMSDLEKKKVPYVYLNLDIEQDFQFVRTQNDLLTAIRLRVGSAPAKVFIDEIQRKPNAGLFLKGLYDMDLPYTFVVTGSGSIDLKSKISESLAGRKRTFIMHPVSFREFLEFRTNYQYKNIFDYLDFYKDEAFSYLKEYLLYGGYPRVITLNTYEEKREYLNEIFNSYLVKDVSQLLNIHKPEAYEKLLYLLAQLEGKIISPATLSKDLKIHKLTIEKYIWYARQTFILYEISSFFRNKIKELKRANVVYFEDIGLSNFLRGNLNPNALEENLGFVFQSFVFQILRDFCERNHYFLHYWRTADGAEVDFVIDTIQDLIPIEIKFKHLTRPTATKSLHSFIATYKPKDAYLINLSLNQDVQVNSTTLHFVSWNKFYRMFVASILPENEK